MKRRIYCTVPQGLIKEPLLFTLGSRFQVIPNIRGASVTEEIAVLTLELEGDENSVAAAVDYLAESGVQIEELSSSDAEGK
ncbi:MAG: NIL domain-containing protein [Planctomycetota bacterium]|jgi:predicted regulator of amino acid metabolism with ACT domain|nr:NIL domain-containing protein [Planctomycetota bacterium]MDP6940597.1 NIL domain-containing protein [Planctomycetota bacterium]